MDTRPISPRSPRFPRLTRRSLFEHVGAGVTGAALAHLFGGELAGIAPACGTENAAFDLRPREPHHPPRARAIIHLFMNGGPSQMDLFDPKPELERRHGEPYFAKIAGEIESPGAAGALLRSSFKFRRHGQSGMEIAEVMPHLARHADRLAVLRGMYTTNLTHEPALYLIQSGRMMPAFPTLGAWVVYALGSENRNLPAYVVLDDPGGLPVNGVDNWQAGFLPPECQGTRFRATGAPVLNLRPETELPDAVVRLERDLIAQWDTRHQRSRAAYPQLAARMASYSLAARMQLAASDALDLGQESPRTLEAYGVGKAPTDSYARRCLIARRLVERGVRFVQLYIDRQIWDHHGQIESGLRSACAKTDQPIGALLTDLEQRGLLDEVLVAWGGEFGRLPIAQLGADKDASKAGRDHNKNAMVCWLAGAGVRGGTVFGETDELGMAAAQNRVSVPDWHATLFHLLGLRHDLVVHQDNGLAEKLTGQHPARVVSQVLA
jgi:hypothetical protein